MRVLHSIILFGAVSAQAATSTLLSTQSVQELGRNKRTYSAYSNVSLAASAADVFTVTGSSENVVRITKIRFTATQTTGNMQTVFVVKRSTPDAGGTSTVSTVVSYDSNNAPGKAIVRGYTANPTAGTLVGVMISEKYLIPAALGNAPSGGTLFEAERPSQSIVLRSTSEVIAINLGNVTWTGGAANIYAEWTEE